MDISHYVDESELSCPLPSTLESPVRAELYRWYHDWRVEEFQEMLKATWRDVTSITIHMFVLESMLPTAAFLSPWTLARFCNKPTILYWLPSAQCEVGAGYPLDRHCSIYVFYCIFKAWFRCHADDPDINFEQFFATPIKITSTGPQTIDEILEAHRTLCGQVTLLLDEVRSGTSEPKRWNSKHYADYYNLLPLCRAVIVVLDEYVLPADPEEENGKFSLDRQVEAQSAILVLTGDTSGLGHPLDFDAIRSESLPPKPSMEAAAASGVETIRVSLKTAIHFIAEAKRREDTTLSNPASRVYDQDPSTDTSNDEYFPGFERAERWVENVMRRESAAPVRGTKIYRAMNRIRERESGEADPRPSWSTRFYHWE